MVLLPVPCDRHVDGILTWRSKVRVPAGEGRGLLTRSYRYKDCRLDFTSWNFGKANHIVQRVPSLIYVG